MKLGLPYTNILKLSEEELELLSGTADPEEGTKKLFCGAMKLIVVTLGQMCIRDSPWTLDGEFGGKVETVQIENHHAAITVLTNPSPPAP